MKKVLLFVGSLAAAIALYAQSVPNGIPTPTEANWPAGIFSYTLTTGTNSTISNAGRQGYAAIGANSTLLTVTNAGVTTNAFIVANLYFDGRDNQTNHVTSVTPSSGTFTVRLRAAPNTNAVIRWLILNY